MPPKAPKDDKTFGMKNKNKSSKVQKHIATVQKQQADAGKSKQDKQKEAEKAKKLEEKARVEAKKRMEAELFGKPAQIQKVPFGTDPKTVLCAYFKAGHCEKGNKCKFSHDRNVERKVEKLNIYEDTRDKETDKKTDLMENWDEEKLRDVVGQNEKKQTNATDIVCKYFIEAIENKKYGWFWECPNGGNKCMYRHALPPGFVLKADKKKAEDAAKKEQISLEDFLEVERHKLKAPLTPVTPESFSIWKKTRVEKKQAEHEALEKAKIAQRAAGKMTGMTGKDMFDFGGELYADDEDGDDEDWDISRMLATYREEEERQAELDRQANEETDGIERVDEVTNENSVEEVTNGVEEVTV
ncbi:hypothetical protein CI109_106873 [Kwoniella shandongensis]|uniref:Uncharacterized protein n=1 Tax=Kwoniella shandongensis TaxID=1734106 RepID=A0A5M6C752_9TREE|nr:uncharacterized protein CI109_000871 [Kwoniella shandongensis]KAA5530691.1 hypothetical protein CI109_000871 [Kwoniella shandongensis]